jgi:L-threonylcarbamoyladenylate synthase
VPDEVTGGLDSVAVRAPSHPVALALVRAAGEPLAAPSANAHMHVSPTTAAHVVRSLGDRVDLVLDGGPCTHGIESTVVDVRSDPPRVLRAGAATLEALRAVVPAITYDAITVEGDAARASPGLASKHYAPRARLAVVEGFRALVDEASRASLAGTRVGVLGWSDEARATLQHGAVGGSAAPTLSFVAQLPADAEGYARALFAALYDADEAKVELLLVEAVPDTPPWWAVRDRLRRAASPLT